jgi:phosphonate transport system substrate-binding protein
VHQARHRGGRIRRRLLPLALALAAAAAGCEPQPKAGYAPAYGPHQAPGLEVIRFAVHPLHNPQRLTEVYGPIVAYLNRRLGGPRLQLEAARSYEEFESKLYGRGYDLALPNPHQAIHALRSGYRIFGKMGDDQLFRGLILVRRDAGLLAVEQLKGRTVGFPAPNALAATMLPLWYLHTHGLDANRDIRRRYTGSQESSIMSVYLGETAAAATWPVPWEAFQRQRPEQAAALVVRWATEPLRNNALVARDDVPPELVRRVAALLFSLHESAEGARLLAAIPISRFEPASAETYEPVRVFLAAYDKAIQ